MATEVPSYGFPFLPIYVGSATWADMDTTPPIVTDLHRHPHPELYLIDGSGVLEVDDRSIEFDAPAAFVVPAGALHRWLVTGPLSLWVIGLKSGSVDEVARQVRHLERAGPIPIPHSEASTIDVLAYAAKRRFEEDDTGGTVTSAYVSALVVQLCTWAPAMDPTSRDADLVDAFLESIDAEGGYRRSVRSHAEQLGVSAAHLSAVTAERLGYSPKDLIAERTLTEARRRLLQTSDSAASIAVALGFADASQFGRWFKRVSGTTPGAFRSTAAVSSAAGEDRTR
ncbi:MAG: helix-turn-helix transcriptional regulator [Actinomycetota bacterium]